VPKQRAGTLNPEPPSCRYSIFVAIFVVLVLGFL
jgi:hypothetical protein